MKCERTSPLEGSFCPGNVGFGKPISHSLSLECVPEAMASQITGETQSGNEKEVRVKGGHTAYFRVAGTNSKNHSTTKKILLDLFLAGTSSIFQLPLTFLYEKRAAKHATVHHYCEPLTLKPALR